MITCCIVDLTVPADHRVKIIKKKKKKKQVYEPCQTTKKTMGQECDGDISCNWHVQNGPQKLAKSWKSEDESRPSKLQYRQDRPEYWEESSRPEEACWI